jgi:Fe-S-cluster-containing dehydrogenase component
MKFNMPTCGGCRTCELGCSFKNEEEFNPSVSSIKILDKPGEPGFSVWIVEEGEGGNIACDGCKDFKVPICMEFCKERDDLEKILNEFKGKRKKAA